jgi:hypothetical protein
LHSLNRAVERDGWKPSHVVNPDFL